jgi:hypothetical protein
MRRRRTILELVASDADEGQTEESSTDDVREDAKDLHEANETHWRKFWRVPAPRMHRSRAAHQQICYAATARKGWRRCHRPPLRNSEALVGDSVAVQEKEEGHQERLEGVRARGGVSAAALLVQTKTVPDEKARL